jgi:hypothetical protein
VDGSGGLTGRKLLGLKLGKKADYPALVNFSIILLCAPPNYQSCVAFLISHP